MLHRSAINVNDTANLQMSTYAVNLYKYAKERLQYKRVCTDASTEYVLI